MKGNLVISGRNASGDQSWILGRCRNEAGAKIVQGRKTFYRGGFNGDRSDFSVSQFTDDLDGLANTQSRKLGS